MNQEPDWQLYRTFLAVVQEGSLSAAARRLGFSQPTMARHIETLEAAVGGDLFVRSARGLIPTDLARSVLPYAESLAATAAALQRAASAATDQVAGTVRVSASEAISVGWMPEILADLRRRHPALAVELIASNTVDDLLRRDADIAVRNVEPVQQSLVARKLPPIELGLFAHRDYLDARGTPESLDELAAHDIIGFDRMSPALYAMVERFPFLHRSMFALRVDSDVVQLAAIRAGYGIGMCQAPIALRDPLLVRVLPTAVSVEMGLWIVMPEELKTSARCRAVFDALVAGLSVRSD